jgi:hypothetical protein
MWREGLRGRSLFWVGLSEWHEQAEVIVQVNVQIVQTEKACKTSEGSSGVLVYRSTCLLKLVRREFKFN